MIRTTLLFVTLAAAALAAQAGERIEVPRGTAPRVDGTMADGEWDDATRVPMRGGGIAYLKHDGDFVYLAFRTEHPGIGTVCTMSGADVHILHASAALGTAIYTRVDGNWLAAQAFRWTNRDTGDTPTALRERAEFIERERWFANVLRQARTEREYQIAIARGEKQMPVVLGFLEVAPETRFVMWPTVADGCSSVRLAQGFLEEGLQFDPAKWGLLVIK